MTYIIFNNLFALIVIIVCGYVMRKQHWIDDQSVNSMSKILMNLALPVTIILSMQQDFSVELLKDGITIIFFSAVMIVGMLFVGYLLSKILKATPEEEGVLIFSAAFPNSVYIGMPVISAMLGQEALFYVSMYVLVHYTLSPTLGMCALQKPLKRTTNLPADRARSLLIFIAIATGLLLFFFSIPIPALIKKPMTMISGMMTPLSMIIIGNNLAKESLKTMLTDKRLLIVSLVKLLVAPLLVYLMVSLFVSSHMVRSVLVYLACMPVAALTTIFAHDAGADEIFASQLVLVSTILSLATIPIVAYFVGS